MQFGFSVHPRESCHAAKELKQSARVLAYNHSSDSIGRYCLTIEIGHAIIDLHDMKPKDIWQLSGNVEEIALQLAPPDGWLETPKPGNLEVTTTEAGPQIIVNPSDDQPPEVVGDIPEESDTDRARRVRLVNSAELLLELAKTVIAPVESAIHLGHEVALLRKRALELVNLVEGAPMPFDFRQRRIYAERKQREGNAGFALDNASTD